MRLTTKGRQAVIAMIDVALRQKAGPVALAGISRRQKISVSYLEQMFTELRRAGLVESTRGPGGGYEIARKVGDITVADIVRAVDHLEIEPVGMQRDRSATDGQQCLTPELWSSLNQRVIEYLDSVSLKKLVDDQPGYSSKSHDAPAPRVEPTRQRAAPSRPKAPNSVFELGAFLAR